MNRSPIRLSPRPDEMLYSILARLTHRLGGPSRSELHKPLLGDDLPIYDDLPVGLEALTTGSWLGMSREEALLELTLFPYYASFAEPGRQADCRIAMAGGEPWPHQALGSWHTDVPPPDRLRFCASCRREMMQCEIDAWWRRVHQLPSVLVCPDHGEVLLQSGLSRRRRRKGYVGPSDEVCPSGAEPVSVIARGRHAEDVLWLARASQALLGTSAEQVARAFGESCRRTMIDRDLDVGVAADVKVIVALVEDHWGPALAAWPGLAEPRLGKAIAAALRSDPAPPLIHLLIAGALRRPGADPMESFVVPGWRADRL